MQSKVQKVLIAWVVVAMIALLLKGRFSQTDLGMNPTSLHLSQVIDNLIEEVREEDSYDISELEEQVYKAKQREGSHDIPELREELPSKDVISRVNINNNKQHGVVEASSPEEDEHTGSDLSINEQWSAKEKRISPLIHLRSDEHWPVTLKPSYGKIFHTLDYSGYTSQDQEFLKSRLSIYESRAARVAEVCAEYHDQVNPVKISTLVWDQRHQPNLVWCEISKVASTTWMMNFLRLGHYKEHDPKVLSLSPELRDAVQFENKPDVNMHFEVFKLFPAPDTTYERARVFKQALRFIIVRHPFTRILSAYRDKMTKLEPRPKRLQFRKLQLHIIDKYRPSTSTDASPHPTFHEFINYILDTTSSHFSIGQWKKAACWKPYWVACGVCTHDFQLIMKIETLEEDNHFITTLANLTEIKKVLEWRGKINNETSTSATALKYFSQLTKEQVRQLYDRFMMDFKLFDYSPNEFIDTAQK